MRLPIIFLILALVLTAGGCTQPQQKEPPAQATNVTTNALSSTATASATEETDRTETHTVSSVLSTSTDAHTDAIASSGTSAITDLTSSPMVSSDVVQTSSPTVMTTTAPVQENTITFKATIRDNINRQPVKGVTVTVYTDANHTPAGNGITDQNGVAHIHVSKAASYIVTLSNLPSGFEANAQYLFSTNTVNITIRKTAVQNEEDHSGAQYAKGKVMTDFTLTDTDGNTYRLSDLLQQNQLVILDFWYVSCEPCKSEFSFFESAIQKYGDKLTLLAINPFDTIDAITALRHQLNANANTGISFPMLQDTCKLSLGFDVLSYPTTVFIRSDGVILDIHVGAYASETAWFTAVERYLH